MPAHATPVHATADPDIRPMSLARCLAHLRASEPGIAFPAHVTLKRWSAAGLLAPALSEAPGRRPLYKVGVVRDICLQMLPGRSARAHPSDPAGNDPQARGVGSTAASAAAEDALSPFGGQVDAAPSPAARSLPAAPNEERLDSVLAQLSTLQAQQAAFQAAVTKELEAIAEQMARLTGAVENLDAVRRMLMLKSDSEVSSMRTRLDSANHELARLRASSSNVDAGKLATVLVRVEEALRQVEHTRSS
jgi:hypothetical protein